MQNAKPRFPADIHLKSNSLVEAWLEIRWHLPPGDPPQFTRDPAFAFALGPFREGIREIFGYIENTDAFDSPFEIAYAVRHRFRPAKDAWPILQIGHGVASVNFTTPYSWEDFRSMALFLREKLLAAYSQQGLRAQNLILRYRNAVPYAYSSNDLLGFLRSNLNVELHLPDSVPGFAAAKYFPTTSNINLTYDLAEPKGTGTLQFVTATSKVDGEVVVWQLGISSGNGDIPELSDANAFGIWLDKAHAAIHEWYFALVEGQLRQSFQGED